MEKGAVKPIKLITPPGVESLAGLLGEKSQKIESTFFSETYTCLNIVDIILFDEFQG
ncbi:hypothetical protein GILI108418_00840 [Gillisia limnaea]